MKRISRGLEAARADLHGQESRGAIQWRRTYPAMFMCSISSYDKQGEPGDEIEHHPQYLVQCNKRVEHRVDRFPGHIEESVVYRVDPIAGKDTNQGRANQQYPVNNRAPQKKCSDSNDIHIFSPFSRVFLK